MQYKRKHRLSAALMAGAMCCTMIPTASADEVATPETAETTATEAVSQSEQPVVLDGGLSVEELQSRMYPSLPQTATEYYLDSNGLPVLTGETKISIEGWGDEDYSDYDADSTIQVALDEALLNTDSATASFPRMDGEDYAIVPISIQVLYPANGGSADITLPDNVELLGYSFTSGDLCAATEEERQRQLHYDFSEVTASVAGIYVKATEDFSVTLTYTDSEKSLGAAKLGSLNNCILLRMDRVTKLMLRAGRDIELAPEAFTALHAAHHACGRAVIPGCDDPLVANDHGPDLAVCLEAA